MQQWWRSTGIILLLPFYYFSLSVPSNLHAVNITRIAGREDFYKFYESTDHFTNLDRGNRLFCEERNGLCRDPPRCETCMCTYQENFISYEHGCQNYNKTVQILNATDCMVYRDYAIILPAITEETFKENYLCRKMFPSTTFDAFEFIVTPNLNCSAQDIYTFDPSNGEERLLLRNKNYEVFGLSTKRGYKCLTRTGDVLEIASMAGRLIKVKITCTGWGNTLNTCFIFKHAETLQTQVNVFLPMVTTTSSLTTTVSHQKLEDKSPASLVVIIVVIIGGILTVLIVVLAFFFRRKMKKNKNESAVGYKKSEEKATVKSPLGRKEFNNYKYEQVENAKDKLNKNSSKNNLNLYTKEEIYSTADGNGLYTDIEQPKPGVNGHQQGYAEPDTRTLDKNPIYGVDEYTAIDSRKSTDNSLLYEAAYQEPSIQANNLYGQIDDAKAMDHSENNNDKANNSNALYGDADEIYSDVAENRVDFDDVRNGYTGVK